ncbi:hypothetical protein BDF20DRAFT_899776 [Mycotypha africana]|uniref:uncharacterized protein n=1 Tax=Mycotypha africana TaxID=64632 RepID=UPI002300B4F0|nr:uncharacterized protein BDF20DRAFT_899776 [Mycotypha africana]KAI8967530.1 hypothetical protein BDF20DRAFT_899776 [Mycotypha africana]
MHLLNTITVYLPLLTCIISIAGWITTFVGLCISSRFTHRTTWWTIIFELIMITLSCGVFWTQTLRLYSPVVLCLIAISFSYVTEEIDLYLYSDKISLMVAAIGYITMLVIQFIWIFLYGTQEDDFMLHGFRELPSSGSFASSRQQQREQYSVNNNATRIKKAANNTSVDTAQAMSQYYATPSTSVHDSLFVPSPMKEPTINNCAQQNTIYLSPNTDYTLPVVAIHNYTANKEDPFELSFNKGEILYVHEKIGSWWQAKKMTGEIGMIPSNYVTARE